MCGGGFFMVPPAVMLWQYSSAVGKWRHYAFYLSFGKKTFQSPCLSSLVLCCLCSDGGMWHAAQLETGEDTLQTQEKDDVSVSSLPVLSTEQADQHKRKD